jgi:segregation and condensation protein A
MESRNGDPLVEPAAPVVDRASPAVDSETPPLEEGAEGTGYRVRLENFEGPLDLLLFLIKRDEIEITDIPIAHITEQFLQSIQEAESLDLDRAGEFLLMAATLMRIKAKMLLPSGEEEEEEDAVDPRAELVRRLLEYKEFKRIGELLGEKEEEWRHLFPRAASPLPEVEPDWSDGLGVSLLDLFRAFRKILEKTGESAPFELTQEEYSVEEQIECIRRECFVRREGVPFTSLFPSLRSRGLVITTFLALLEMVRRGEIEAVQADTFGEIWLKQKEVVSANES